MNRQRSLVVSFCLAVWLSACQPASPMPIEVTRVVSEKVTQLVEVTRVVPQTVVVTREVVVTSKPEPRVINVNSVDWLVPLQINRAFPTDVNEIALSPVDNLLALSTASGTVQLWHVPDGTLQASMDIQSLTLGFLPDGNTLVVISVDGIAQFRDPYTTRVKQERQLELGMYSTLRQMIFSSDGHLMALRIDHNCPSSGCWGTYVVEMRETTTGDKLWKHGVEYTQRIDFTPSNDVEIFGGLGQEAELLDRESGESKGKVVYDAPDAPIEQTDYVSSQASSTYRDFRATGSANGIVYLWDANQKLIHILRGHTMKVSSLAFSHNNDILASGNQDGTMRIWSVQDVDLIRTLTGFSSGVSQICFSPNDRYLVALLEDGSLSLWAVVD